MMNSKDYGVRVVVAYENKRVGQVIYPPGTLRSALVSRGFVQPVEPPAEDKPETMKRVNRHG